MQYSSSPPSSRQPTRPGSQSSTLDLKLTDVKETVLSPLSRKLFILGFFFPPLVPWVVCLVTIKRKPRIEITRDDQYWAFMCLAALTVALGLLTGVFIVLGLEFGWFGRVVSF